MNDEMRLNMWDIRYGALAAQELAEQHAAAARARLLASVLEPHGPRRRLGLLLVRWGTRLAAPSAMSAATAAPR